MLFKNTFRVESARLPEYDYSNCAWYYVTINIHNHKSLFGTIQNDVMILNAWGNIAKSEWLEIPRIRGNVDLDEFIIMPNHIHGIIIINGGKTNIEVSQTNQMQNLANIIKGFKGSVTSKIKACGFTEFRWQSRYYDRIIRTERELFYIRQYIVQNPLRWSLDKELPENLF